MLALTAYCHAILQPSRLTALAVCLARTKRGRTEQHKVAVVACSEWEGGELSAQTSPQRRHMNFPCRRGTAASHGQLVKIVQGDQVVACASALSRVRPVVRWLPEKSGTYASRYNHARATSSATKIPAIGSPPGARKR